MHYNFCLYDQDTNIIMHYNITLQEPVLNQHLRCTNEHVYNTQPDIIKSYALLSATYKIRNAIQFSSDQACVHGFWHLPHANKNTDTRMNNLLSSNQLGTFFITLYLFPFFYIKLHNGQFHAIGYQVYPVQCIQVKPSYPGQVGLQWKRTGFISLQLQIKYCSLFSLHQNPSLSNTNNG